jgi:hypothetical protein
MNMKSAFFVLLALTSTVASAGEFLLHTASIHTEDTYSTKQVTNYIDSKGTVVDTKTLTTKTEYNNSNLGVGYRTDSGYVFGVYHNSYRQLTAYAAKEFMFTQNVGAFAGFGTGYKIPTGKPVTVLGGLLFKHQLNKDYALNVLALPPTGNTAGVLHLVIAKSWN